MLTQEERTRIAKRNRRAGKSYESEVAAMFRKALYPEFDGVVKRVASSGGIKGMVRADIKAYKLLKGEPHFDPRWDLQIECKYRKSLNFLGMFTGVGDTPLTWYLEASSKSKLKTVVVFRQLNITQSFYFTEAQNFPIMWECGILCMANKEFYFGRLEDFIESYKSKHWLGK